MTGKVKVHFGVLSDSADSVDRAVEQLQEHLTAVDELVTHLVATWTGAASEEFHGYVHQWQQASDDLHASLRELHRTLTTAHGNYAAAESANLRMWGSR
ncbi:MAG: WXG100 family type VII secretion target [Pseudonocardiaceae bacterium]